jgi:cytochrome c5
MSKLLKLCAIAIVCVTATVAQELAERDGVKLVREKCLTCHEADLIVQQKLLRAGWTREVDKMIRWGTVVTDAEREAIITYLAGGETARINTTAGRTVFDQKCLTCHEADLSEQQRLSRAGWTREVDKMIRWGAVLSEEEKSSLIDFLTGQYGPGPR